MKAMIPFGLWLFVDLLRHTKETPDCSVVTSSHFLPTLVNIQVWFKFKFYLLFISKLGPSVTDTDVFHRQSTFVFTNILFPHTFLNTNVVFFWISVATRCLRVFVLFYALVFVRTFLSWCPKTWNVYTVYNILSLNLTLSLIISIYIDVQHTWI